MKSAKKIEIENSGDRIKTEKIFENERKYITDLISQCDEKNKVHDIPMDIEDSVTATHYKLENGIHIYMMRIWGLGKNVKIISPEEIPEEELNGTKVGTWIEYWPQNKSIRYNVNDGSLSFETELTPQHCIKSSNENAGVKNRKRSEIEIPDSIETMVDVWGKLVEEETANQFTKKVTQNRINGLYIGLSRSDLKTYTPEELRIMALESEVLEQKVQISKLQSMLSKALEFANIVKESTIGKIFFKKSLKELNMDGTTLPSPIVDGEER